MHPMQFSSGDVVTDRRADYAKMLDDAGDPAAAAELMEQALELAPRWTAGWQQLADYREKSGDEKGAETALRRVLELDPEDIFAASLKLARLGAIEVPDQPPSRYVEALFDDYADRFETALVEKLDYSVPPKLSALLRRVAGEGRRFRHAVDLGCGTGLLGIEIRDLADRLEGFDLSAGMLAKAEEKGVYDLLAQADLSLDSPASGLFADGLAEARVDLVCAADVFMYLGSLEATLELLQRLAATGAMLAFSVEDGGDVDGFGLAESLRYVHSETYVRSLLDRFGFKTLCIEKTTIRMDGGKPVFGILFVAVRDA
ncbi:methyltransferase domain-containing protein [Ciceribacter sp. L1K22]|uniref:class I SAM-dependent DNA methyltransferase n=1 Tax=Ciceribacter sp. L1K22 TaxID=2820275 RepID=UPI001ABEC213|nr:methyltransferase domain-containing protein [Ciceribacter sp. L1K22]MBO3758875.1 methyltransferase domain-containing protein [Ciceribacter sp. L1K22]